TGIQECPDELQQPLVLDSLGDLTHQFVVIDSIEEFLQIKINAPAVAFGEILLRLCHCLMSRPPWPEPIAVIGKRPVPPPLQNLPPPLGGGPNPARWGCKLFNPPRRVWVFPPASPASARRSRSTVVPGWLANAVSDNP